MLQFCMLYMWQRAVYVIHIIGHFGPTEQNCNRMCFVGTVELKKYCIYTIYLAGTPDRFCSTEIRTEEYSLHHNDLMADDTHPILKCTEITLLASVFFVCAQ